MSDKTRNEWQNDTILREREMSDKTRNEWQNKYVKKRDYPSRGFTLLLDNPYMNLII